MRREAHADRAAGQCRQLLLDLRGVAVRGDPVGLQILVGLRIEVHRIDLPALGPGAGHARLAVDDDSLETGQPVLHQRRRRQDPTHRVAAGGGDQRGPGDDLSVQLRQSVHGIGQRGRIDVRRLVPGDVVLRIPQAVVRREIDDLAAASPQARHRPLRFHVRQRQEHHVGDVGQPAGIEIVEGEVAEPPQMRVRLGERLAGQPLGGDPGQGHAGMDEQQTQELGAHVAAGARDGNADAVGVGHGAQRLEYWNFCRAPG